MNRLESTEESILQERIAILREEIKKLQAEIKRLKRKR